MSIVMTVLYFNYNILQHLSLSYNHKCLSISFYYINVLNIINIKKMLAKQKIIFYNLLTLLKLKTFCLRIFFTRLEPFLDDENSG